MFPPTSQTPDPIDTMTSTAQDLVEAQNEPTKPTTKLDPKVKKRNDEFRTRISTCKAYRRKQVANWTVSIDYRRGKPFSSQTDQDQVAVNLDWGLTKGKQAGLFSQVPKIRIDHPPQTLPKSSPWLWTFEQRLNELLVEGGIESSMDEVLPDVINAAGIGAILVSYDSITEDREVPAASPTNSPEVGGQPQDPTQSIGTPPTEPAPMVTVPYTLDKRYVIQRISPSDFLWPVNFTGSDFDTAPWIGRTGRLTWSEAVKKFNLKEEDKHTILGEDRSTLDTLTHDMERDKSQADEQVSFDELFYKEYKYDDTAQSYSTIHHLVFVTGKDEPVIDEPWKGQRIGPDGSLIGSTLFPIRVLTLSYITDEAIPPSDSAIGRPQVDEINKARTQMIKQRERSLPIRWFDVNRIDPAIQQSLIRGVWQAMIPVQGEGSRTIGEVSRAQMPNETFMFDKIAKADLLEEFGVASAVQQEEIAEGDPDQNKSNFNTRAGRERAKVTSFVVSVGEVLGGLMCLYEEATSFGEGFNPSFSKGLKYSILADSTVLLDVSQKLARLNNFINLYAKSGWVNLEPVMQEVATLSGLDPALVIQPPQPKPPVEPNISLRLTGVEDLLNPLTLAFMIKSGQAPPPELIEQAKSLIQQAVMPPVPPQAQGMNPDGNQEGGSEGLLPNGSPADPGPLPPTPPFKVGEANPNMSAMPQINKRSEPGGTQ